MDVKKAGDIMIPLNEYPHVPYWYTITQAMEEMEKAEFDVEGRKSLPRAVLVFNDKYELLGIVRRRDILRGLEPDFLANMMLPKRKKLFETRTKPGVSGDRLLRGMRKRAERPVSDIMIPIKHTIDYDDHLMKAVYEMVSNNLSLIPVLKNGEVAGVVRTVELVFEMGKLLHG